VCVYVCVCVCVFEWSVRTSAKFCLVRSRIVFDIILCVCSPTASVVLWFGRSLPYTYNQSIRPIRPVEKHGFLLFILGLRLEREREREREREKRGFNSQDLFGEFSGYFISNKFIKKKLNKCV
jgi:hypothetical protein